VTDTVDKLRPLAQSSGLHLKEQVLPHVWVTADRDRLEQVLTNLIDNAVKYTPSGGRIDVCVRASGDDVEVAVSDTGLGIPLEDVPRVFERFYRADRSRARGPPPSGEREQAWVSPSPSTSSKPTAATSAYTVT